MLEVSTSLTPHLNGWSLYFSVGLTRLIISVAVSILSRIYGKRSQYLFATLMSVVATIICITSFSTGSYPVLRAGRLVSGLAASAFESIAFVTIVDL